MADDLDNLVPAAPLAGRKLTWSAVVGGGFGMFLGIAWAAWGFKAFLAAALLGLLGGFLGRLYVGDQS